MLGMTVDARAQAKAETLTANNGRFQSRLPCFSNWAMSCRSSHVIKLKLSSQLIGQFGHVTASASCKQPENIDCIDYVTVT